MTQQVTAESVISAPASTRREHEIGLFRAGVLEEVEAAIFGPADEVRDLVAIEIDDGRADIMAFDAFSGQCTGVFHDPVAVLAFDLAEEVGVG
jgi:hypothetical protein